MEPLIGSALQEIATVRRDFRAEFVGVPTAALNWRPYSEGNTIAGLVAHMYDAANFLLHTGLGEAIQRDREGKFAASTDDLEALLAEVDRQTERILALAARYTADDLAREHHFRGMAITGSWFVVHACTHLLEHWGQIQMIRDLHGR